MTFLEPFGEPKQKSNAATTTPMAPWTQRRLLLAGTPLSAVAVLGSAIAFHLIVHPVPWYVLAGLAGFVVIAVAWATRAIRSGEWTAISAWQAAGEAMQPAGEFEFGKRLDSFFVGQHGGIVVTVSPPPRVSQTELDEIGHRAATASMLRAEPVEIVKTPRRLRRGTSVRFGFVPK